MGRERTPCVPMYPKRQNFEPVGDEAILDPELWQIVQNKLAVHRQERALAVARRRRACWPA